MKKIFTHLFALFLFSFLTTSAWAQTTVTLTPSSGSYNSTGNWASKWTSTTEPTTTLSVSVNNMYTNPGDGTFEIAPGTAGSSVWSFVVNGHKILSYTFTYKLKDTGTIKITADGEEHVVTSEEQTLTANSNSFTLSGTNKTIILRNVTIEAEPLLEDGKVYRFVNVGDTNRALSASALTDAGTAALADDRVQQWQVAAINNGNYTFRNLANGRCLQGNNTTSGGWSLTEDSNEFTVTLVNGNYCFRGASHTSSYAYMHRNGSNDIVSWETSSTSTQWTKELVEYDEDGLQAVWEEVEALVVPSATVDTYEEYLDILFSDKSCVTPKLGTLDAAKATDAYNNLPAALQKMVDKVYGGNWAESTVAPADRPNGNNNTNHSLWTVADTWEHDYAKKFRVQMYEPYSIEGEITSYLRFNAHCNMDNPTGIYADGGEPIYIMVEGTIEQGAELWIAHQTGHGATGYYSNATYTRLHEGLNVVPYFNDGSQLWINYLVHTYDSETRTFPHKLSEYKPLKIHIEGGYINGFFNAMGDYRASDSSTENLWGDVDNDEDWNYYKARAALSGDFALLGHRQTLLFDFGTYNSDKGHFGVANADGGIEYALAYHLEHITVPETPNCYVGSGTGFGNYSDTYYPGMQLDAETGKINIMLEAWDRIMYSEHATMGLLSQSNIDKMNKLYPGWASDGTPFDIYNYGSATVNGVTQTYKEFCEGRDYSDYYNHHGAAVGAGSGYMSGGWRVCNYHYNTMGSIIGKIAVEAGPTWGPAHEIGHQHQGVFNLNGQTEVTNNFFSNVAVWYMGMGTSRYNGSEGNLEHVLAAYNTDGNDLYTNNIWALTHIYYRLWLYYHLAGNNTQFWPRLFELCRQIPIMNGGQISGETSLLRFYQHACNAAGEDLTEFFRAHGYFELMTNRVVGDYSNGTYNVTEEQIETAITTIEEKGYPKNYAILLINDGTSETTLKHDGATNRSLWDSNPSAELGSVNDFIDGDAVATTDYAAAVSADGTVTMTGTGGVGFLIFNEEGELVSFSNKKTFAISDEAAYLLATGKATISAVNTESEISEVDVDLSAIQREMLLALINKVEAMPIDDGSYTHVGFYTKASAAELLAALESAKTAYESGSGYGAAYEMLYAEKEKFVNSQSLSYVPFDPSLTYVITNCAYSDKTMHLNNGLKSATGVDQTANTAMWKFVETDTEGVYYVQNAGGNYLTTPAKSANVGSSSLESDAAKFTLMQESPVGAWSISLSPAEEYTTLHDNSYGSVVGWSTGVDPSKWYLTAVENDNLDESLVAADELQALITKTEALVDVVGMAIPCALQTTDNSAPFYLYCNANVTSGCDKSLPADGYNILDGNDQTFLHTVYSGNSVDGLNHYLLLDLGEGNTLSTIQFYYKTRHNGDSKSHPQVIKVEGSNDKETFVEIETISSGLPSEYSAEYTSSELTNGNEYRYFRFMVTDTYGTKTDGNGHEYFYIAEFGIPSLPDVYTKIDAEYQAYVTETDMQTIYNAIVTAKTALESGTDLSTAKDDLQDAYDKFYALYKKPIDEKKTELETLADATDAVIAQVGTVELGVETPIALSASNLYCNQVDTNESGSGNSYIGRLTDGDPGTYLHTTSTEGYLRIDLGENSTATAFKFSYTTRSNGNNRPTNIVVEGCNEQDGTYTTITELSEGLPSGNAAVYNSDIINMSQAYRYVRLRVTNAITNSANSKIFVMSEFSITTVMERNITIETAYDGIVSEDLLYSTYNTSGDSHLMATETSNPTLAQLEAQITKLTDAKAALEAAMNQVDKSELNELIATATTLYNKMSDGKGNMNADYATSSLTAEQLTAVKDALDAAQSVVEYAGSTQLQVNEAKYALNEKYQVLVSVDETNEKSTLETDDLTTLIGNVKTFLGTIATEVASSKVALPLTTTTGADYSITTAGVGDGSLANLIDKNADGTGNTGTYYGSLWLGGVEAYSQYIEIDLGVGIALDELSFDYTTRDSGHSTERPKVIKLLGSNDKNNYVEIKEFTDGMPVGQCQQWTMAEMFELAARYRYIRFSVDSDNHSFHMSDFNVYTNIDYAVADYYTTATDLDLVGLCVALQSAEDLLTRSYLTTEQYNAVYEKLNSCYTAANDVKNADVDDRDELATLIEDTNTLINKLSTVTEVLPVTLSVDNLYCNADNSTNTGAGADDKLGVAALLDGSVSTHLHTTYGNNAQDDDLDHYLRVDAGADNAVAAFEFNYTGRSSNSNNDPSVIVIQGCNTIDGEWEEIKTLTGLPTDGDKVQYSSDLIESDKAFRYIRFMVTETQNNSETTYNGKTHRFFVMSEFGFTAHPTVEIGEGHTNVTTTLVRTAYNEKNSAATVTTKEHYISNSDYDAILDELQTAYDALNIASIADKSELEALVEATAILQAQLYEYTYTTEEITLQNGDENAAGYIYCNADGSTNDYDGDNLGVSALLDNDTDTDNFLHTTYNGDDNDDDLDHYLRVDLGEAKPYVQFRYKGRSGYPALTPKTAVVQATNDLSGTWTDVKTLNNLTKTTDEVTTGCLGYGVAYRYWRFMVTDTYDGRKNNGHPYYALSAFNVDVCDVTASSLKYSPSIYAYTTTELVAEVENEMTAANEVINNDDADLKQGDVDDAVAALRIVHDKLAEALKYANIPVFVTSDEENPILYNIQVNRDFNNPSATYLQYNESEKYVNIAVQTENASYQAWYFMEGSNGALLIKPYNGDGKVLGADDNGNGHTKVWAVENGTKNICEWTIEKNGEWYNILGNGKCFSNHSGNTHKTMGFYDDKSDGGSQFKFIKATFSNDNPRFYQLSDFENTLEYQTANTPEGTTVGAFVNGTAYSDAYTIASALISNGNTSDAATCHDAYTALRAASEAVEMIMPDPAKYYVLRCNYEDRYIYVNADNKLQWAASSYDKTQSRAVWQFEDIDASAGTCKMKSLHTQSYMQTISSENQVVFSNEGAVVTIAPSTSVAGAVIFEAGNDNIGLHAHGSGNRVIGYGNGAGANHYFFEEVGDVTTIKHDVTMKTQFSSVTLGYNATVPAGVEAYTASGLEDGYTTLHKVAGATEVLPANTPVILYIPEFEAQTTVTFNYTESEAVVGDEIQEAINSMTINGSLYTKYVKCDDNADYYKLMIKNGEAKMYLMYKEFNAQGVSQGATHDGGHIKCSANKIYMKIPGANGMASFGMRFATPGTTGIDELKGENAEGKEIYDLTGRKLSEITEPGFYIVNGKKMYVK